MSFTPRFRTVLCGALASIAMTGTALAQASYPAEPIKMIVAFAPGGITDMLSRQVAAELGKVLKQNVLVDNRPGAGGQVGTEYVKRLPADGYTLLVAASGFAMAPAQKPVGYDPEKDFEPVALLGSAPNVLVVHPSVPVNNVKELVELSKKQGGLPYASAGTGGANHLAGVVFQDVSGAQLVHVPYKGAAPATTDLVAGSVPSGFIDLMTIKPHIEAGRAKPLALTSATRSALMPKLPTIAESGYPGYDVSVWMGVFAPAKTPAHIVQKLNEAIRTVLKQPELSARLQSNGIDLNPNMTADDFRQYVKKDLVRWKQVTQKTGIKFD
jgi:tripartite-type tricarboxylate transporter receptor subunit TctC